MDLPHMFYFPCALLLSVFFLQQSSVSLSADNPSPISPHQTIVQCLIRHSVPRSLIFSPKSKNFTTAFSSPLQNQRVIHGGRSHMPLLIVTPTHESHAQAAVLCSRHLNLQLRTRSGGHDYEGLSYISTFGPFLMLDLLNLRSISLDLHGGQNTAWVHSGATLGELYFAIASKSSTLAFPAGYCPTVGVGGHIPGGGIGPLMRAHGVAADHVVDVRIINADGEILQRESMGEDLFWAVRGGGGASFGVILAYKIELVDVPLKVTVFSKTLDLSQGATRAVQQWQQEAYRVDHRIYISAALIVSNNTVQATFSSLFLGRMTELLSVMKKSLPALQLAPVDCKEMSWVESLVVFSFFPLPNINGGPATLLLDRRRIPLAMSFKVKSDIVTEPIAEQSWKKIWKYVIDAGVHLTMLIEPLGGKVAEVAETGTPFPHRNGSKFVIQYILTWLGEEEEAPDNFGWLGKFYQFMAPFVSKNPRAAYLNFRDLDLGRNEEGKISYREAEGWGRKYYKVNFERLAHAKAKTDPENFFRNEQSIPPLF